MKIFFIIIIVFSLSNCVYYNMFFNAKKNYNLAEKKYLKSKTIDRGLYDKSIKEASKILEFYPDSKWVDDALLLMGKSYYRRGNFRKSIRKYQEIIANYPNSDLLLEAKLNYAKALIALKDFSKAKKVIKTLPKSDKEVDDKYTINNLYGELKLSEKDSLQALNYFVKAAGYSNSEANKIANLKKAGEIAENLKDYRSALNIAEKNLKFVVNRKDIFENKLKVADAYQNLNHPDSARAIYLKLIENEDFSNYAIFANFALSQLFYKQQEYDNAYKKLEEILSTNKKTTENRVLLGKTSFCLGKYFGEIKRDIKQAKTFYDSVKYFTNNPEYMQKSLEKRKVIDKYYELKLYLENHKFYKDSLQDMVLDLKSKVKDDTIKYSKTMFEYNRNVKKLEKFDDRLVSANYRLAEIFYYDFNYLDSADIYLKKVFNSNYKCDAIASKAMLMYSIINPDNKQYEDSILVFYPQTKAANYIRNERWMDKEDIVEDSLNYYYNLASEAYLDSNYQESSNIYDYILKTYYDSDLLPKIMKTAALINDKYLYDNEKAVLLYKEIRLYFPDTKQADFANMKLRPIDAEVDESKTTEKNDKRSSKDEKYDNWYLMDRRNN